MASGLSRTCSGCGEEKPIEDFYPVKRNKAKTRDLNCKQCHYEKHQTPSYREYERTRKARDRAAKPMMEPVYQARARIRHFEQQKREFDHVS